MSKYVIIKPEENCGMCGYIWQTIRAIYHNPNKNYYIDFDNSIYKTSDENVWDKFFEQPHIKNKPTHENIEKQVGIIFDQDSEFVISNMIPNTKEEIQKRRNSFSQIIDKYIKLKPHIKQKIDSFDDANFKGKKVLGVHFRGTDHPFKNRMCDYMQAVKEKLVDYDTLFVCSDEQERFKMAKFAFSKKIVYWNSLRSEKGNIPLHSHPNDYRYSHSRTEEYQYKIAEDVIIESYLLSKCDFIMCCPASNVNYFARAINPNVEYLEL